MGQYPGLMGPLPGWREGEGAIPHPTVVGEAKSPIPMAPLPTQVPSLLVLLPIPVCTFFWVLQEAVLLLLFQPLWLGSGAILGSHCSIAVAGGEVREEYRL
jgi:hypothetical protein